ncbi:MAG: extracellular solute-binding protein, partial [Anaerolineales bacterium]|nr:extracellular solute-binding protein [Anaerolineales bacterium]
AHGNYYLLYNEVAATLETTERPDVVVALSEELPVWDAVGAIVELTPYVNDPIWGFSKADLSDFPSVFLAQEQIADRWLGLPAQRTARFLVYNRTWGAELGFDAPPLNFDEFREQACAANQAMRADEITENDGKGGWIVDARSLSVLSWMRAFGGGPLDGDEYRFLIPENIEAFKSLKELFDVGCAWVSTENTPYEQFASRSALFATASMEEFSDVTGAFIQQGSTDEWTAIPFPGTVQTSVVTYGSSYALLATDDAQQLAGWLFVRWMLAPENQTRWVKSTALFPLRISALEELADYQDGHPQWAASVDLISQAEIQPQVTSWRQVRPILGDGFAHIFRVNTQAGSVSAILAEMGSTVSEMTK